MKKFITILILALIGITNTFTESRKLTKEGIILWCETYKEAADWKSCNISEIYEFDTIDDFESFFKDYNYILLDNGGNQYKNVYTVLIGDFTNGSEKGKIIDPYGHVYSLEEKKYRNENDVRKIYIKSHRY